MEVEEPQKKKLKLNNDANSESTTVIDIKDGSAKCSDKALITSEVKPENVAKHGKEVGFGITEFINNNVKASGILKQRFSDFMVRECDLEGKPVYLTNLDNCDHELKGGNMPGTADSTPCPIAETLLEKVKEFANSEDKTVTMTLDIDNDKEHRKVVHKYIKDTFKSIETGTVTLDDQTRAIILSFKSNNSNTNKRKSADSKNVPKYCHFVLFKQNKDTMDCVNLLAKMLHTKSQLFSYAGTKDRRATTVQRLCVQNMLSKRLQGLNARLKNVALGNFSYSKQGISLGDLSGNEFTIIIRNLVSQSDLAEACTSLKENGFINYFGLQRFGTGAVSTNIIGRALLSEQYEVAVDMILRHREDEENTSFGEHAAKKIWTESKDAKKAKKAVKSNYSIEGKLLDALSTGGAKNFLNAIQKIPRNMRLLYAHSYQSFIWNKAVSKRIKDHGLKPYAGDLVLNKEKDERGFANVTVITGDDISHEKYNIYDIVLPMPGYDMKYPGHEIHQYYKTLLENDGLDINNMRHKQKDFSLSGSYRNIVVKPKHMAWEQIFYDDFKVSLIENDYEKLTSKTTPVTYKETGSFKALKLEMTLPPSSYATSALREVLDHEASYNVQVSLNEACKLKNDAEK